MISICHAVFTKPGLTLQVAGDVVLNLIVTRGAEEQSPVHQRELFEHRQRPVTQSTVDHVSLARAEGRQDEPAEQHGQHVSDWILLSLCVMHLGTRGKRRSIYTLCYYHLVSVDTFIMVRPWTFMCADTLFLMFFIFITFTLLLFTAHIWTYFKWEALWVAKCFINKLLLHNWEQQQTEKPEYTTDVLIYMHREDVVQHLYSVFSMKCNTHFPLCSVFFLSLPTPTGISVSFAS